MTTPPSTLVLLPELANIKSGTKVRFAGRIISYDIETGHLTLSSDDVSQTTPPSAPPDEKLETKEKKAITLAHVDTALVLQQAVSSPRLFEQGTTVNVIGYVVIDAATASSGTKPVDERAGASTRKTADLSARSVRGKKRGWVAVGLEYTHCFVQAIMLWEAAGESVLGFSSDSERRLAGGDMPADARSKYEGAVLARRQAMERMALARGEHSNP